MHHQVSLNLKEGIHVTDTTVTVQVQPALSVRSFLTTRSPASVWWLVIITFGVSYLVWYDRLNAELDLSLGRGRTVNGRWFTQLVPIWSSIGLHMTAEKVNNIAAQRELGVRVSPVATWLWFPFWFATQNVYLQKRVNLLASVR
jgi:hypothetical protein